MSSLTTYCPKCGNELDPVLHQYCPHCAMTTHSVMAQEEKRWGVGTGLLVWFASVALLVAFQVVALIVYLLITMRQTGGVPKLEIDWLLAVLSIASTFPAHLLTLLICWLVVTNAGKRPFLQTMGWGWHPQFKWIHAVALAGLMLGITISLEQVLPHKETDLEKLLKMGIAVRWLVAGLAVLTAPWVEEIVYRGVLYVGIERAWGKVAGVILVTALFALVHLPQYWGSYAAIASIISLSLVLTLLRAATGKLLPCVATHMVYNGVQGVALLFGLDKMVETYPPKTAMLMVCQWLGLN